MSIKFQMKSAIKNSGKIIAALFVCIIYLSMEAVPQEDSLTLTTEQKLMNLFKESVNEVNAKESEQTDKKIIVSRNSSKNLNIRTQEKSESSDDKIINVEVVEKSAVNTSANTNQIRTTFNNDNTEKSEFPFWVILLPVAVIVIFIYMKLAKKGLNTMQLKVKRFKDWGLSTKIIGVSALSIGVFTLVVLFYFLPIVSDQLTTDKIESTRGTVEVAYSFMAQMESKVASGQLSDDEAKKLALENIKSLRYAGDNYFWVNDMHPTMVMHPFKPELDGKDLSENKDPDGKRLFVEFVDVCKKDGEGFVNYMWPKPGHEKPQPKISYVKLYKPWGWIVGSGVYVDDIEELIAGIRNKILLVLMLIFAFSITLSLYMGKYIGKPVVKLTKVANALALGDTDAQISTDANDEIGQLTHSFSKMIDNIRESSQVAEKISEGDLDVTINMKSEKDLLSKSMQKMIDTLRQLISEVKEINGAAVEGKLTHRGKIEKYQGEFKEIVSGLNQTLDAIAGPFHATIETLRKLAANDLTVKMTNECRGDYQQVKTMVNSVSEALRTAMMQVAEAVQATASAANQISSSTEQMAAGAQEQSSQTTEVAGAVEEMTKTILETSKNTSLAADASKNAGKVAKDGGKVVEETIHGMNRIADVVKSSADTVKALGKSSEQIGEIVQVINDIADQTNLLALNAAIEAARAGEQGRGFAVVADEVRKLAERTTKATKEIASMIRQIQKDTNDAVDSMQRGTDEVEKGKSLAQKAGDTLREIINGADKVVDIVSQVAAASEEQSTTAEQISRNIESMNNVTQESASGIQQIAHAAEDLNKLTYNLQELVSRFTVNETPGKFSVKQNGKLMKADAKYAANPASLIDV